jgi:acetyl-CoA carboxylase biotin carboxyl carrier protein
VADDPNEGSNPFDLNTIKVLVGLMSRHDLSEIDLQQGNQRLRLRRGARQKTMPVAFAPSLPAAAPPPPAAPTPAAEKPPEKPAKKLLEVKSSAPGTFYTSPKPGTPPYVTKGSRVTPTTVVGQIEAMKVFSELQAECSGVIEEILVDDKQPVEFGQVLFKVDPTG